MIFRKAVLVFLLSFAIEVAHGKNGQKKKPVKRTKPHSPTKSPPCNGTQDDLLKILSQVSNRTDLLKTGSPQNNAYNWLFQDSFYCYSDHKITQRYIMALTYFSTNGDKWTNCGRKGGSSTCDPLICLDFGRKPNLGNTRWLGKGSECSWCGVACNTDNKSITEIDLGTYIQILKKRVEKKIYVFLTNGFTSFISFACIYR